MENSYFSDSIVPFDKRAWQNPTSRMWPEKVSSPFRVTGECEMCGNLITKFVAGEVWDICDKCRGDYTYAEIQEARRVKALLRKVRKFDGNNL